MLPIINLLNADRSTLVVKVSGSSDFARKFSGRPLDIDFDVAVAANHPHYKVMVEKILPEKFKHSFVDTNTRTIRLMSQAIFPRAAMQNGPNPASTSNFISVPHEFGHAMQYDNDEYRTNAPSHSDVKSLMNIGREIRPRHLVHIKQELNKMFLHTHFDIVDS